MKSKDVKQIDISDLHCGGTTAIFPNYPMSFKDGEKNSKNHTPTPLQSLLYNHLMMVADKIKERRGNARFIVNVNGDSHDGHHHNSIQVVSTNPQHHVEIHIEVMDNFLERIGFSVKRGDELNYISGTEIHTGWMERNIAEHFETFGATFEDERQDVINGRLIWHIHQGRGVGSGATEGDAYRNWLKSIYFDCEKEKTDKPDLIVSSHFHKVLYQVYARDYHSIHGIVTPSFQVKTRHGLRVAPFMKNDIGLTLTTITTEGDMRFERPYLLDKEKIKEAIKKTSELV